jgi:hypothetical protein
LEFLPQSASVSLQVSTNAAILTVAVVSVLIVIIALAVNGPDTTGSTQGGTGYWGEPPNEPLIMRLGPNPATTYKQQFDSVLNVAFAYAGNQVRRSISCLKGLSWNSY